MRQTDTEKYHKLDREGNILKETFKSVTRFLGIVIDKQTHKYQCDTEKNDRRIGFNGDTKTHQ